VTLAHRTHAPPCPRCPQYAAAFIAACTFAHTASHHAHLPHTHPTTLATPLPHHHEHCVVLHWATPVYSHGKTSSLSPHGFLTLPCPVLSLLLPVVQPSLTTLPVDSIHLVLHSMSLQLTHPQHLTPWAGPTHGLPGYFPLPPSASCTAVYGSTPFHAPCRLHPHTPPLLPTCLGTLVLQTSTFATFFAHTPILHLHTHTHAPSPHTYMGMYPGHSTRWLYTHCYLLTFCQHTAPTQTSFCPQITCLWNDSIRRLPCLLPQPGYSHAMPNAFQFFTARRAPVGSPSGGRHHARWRHCRRTVRTPPWAV